MSKIYLAGAFKKHKEEINLLSNHLRLNGHDVFVPMENVIDPDSLMSNENWGLKVFQDDVDEINKCEIMLVALFSNHDSSGGTPWEIGYAYGISKKIIIIHYEKTIASVMIANSTPFHVFDINDFLNTDINCLPERRCTIKQT